MGLHHIVRQLSGKRFACCPGSIPQLREPVASGSLPNAVCAKAQAETATGGPRTARDRGKLPRTTGRQPVLPRDVPDPIID